MHNRNDDTVKLPKGENFWSQPYEEPLLQSESKSKSKKIIHEFSQAIELAQTLLTPAKLNKDKFDSYMKGDFARIANLYNELITQYDAKDVREIQKKLGELQKKINQSKQIGHEISEILNSLESTEAKRLSETPSEEEVSKLINELSMQIDSISKELDRLFKFSTSLHIKHGSVPIFKQAKDVLKSDIEKILQQLTHQFVKTLGFYSKIFQETDSEQRDQIFDKLWEMHKSANDLNNLFNQKLEVKPIYNIDNDLKKKITDILETIFRYIETTENLGYVPPKLEGKEAKEGKFRF